MEESKLIFSLNRHDDGPSVVFSKDKPQTRESWPDCCLEMSLDLNQGQSSQPVLLHHSPSSPNSLSDLSAPSADLLITPGLVKSSSTDLKVEGGNSTLRGKPLLSLVKSFSTEISCRVEPEVSLSKSDTKLHLQPSEQVTHPRTPEDRPEGEEPTENEGWASPLSAGSMSPTEPRGSLLIAELEDTRRKFSEAMQDPLSMLSKIMGDESSVSPKQRRASGTGDSLFFQGSCEKDASSEDSDLRWRRRMDSRHRAECESLLKPPQKDSPVKTFISPEHHLPSRESRLEICTYGDVLQVVELQGESRRTHHRNTRSPVTMAGSSLPLHWLLPVGLLAYGLFVLPVPPYVASLSLGAACGFLLGMVVVFIFAPRRTGTGRNQGSLSKAKPTNMKPLDGKLRDTGILEVTRKNNVFSKCSVKTECWMLGWNLFKKV